jgi:pSer/pThr/pTyr-binding forkhead associated (FHA) protein
MDKCPFCSAETRPGDNFCLNCGNRLQPSTPSPQAAAPQLEPTAAPTEWAPPAPQFASSENSWSNPDLLTIAADPADAATMRPGATVLPSQAAPAVMNKIEEPAHLILRADNNEILQDYVLDKFEMSIGRAPNSDILLSKDKLTSRRHATILYENGQYSIRDERSANGTFVNSQQLDESSMRVLQNGDHIGIGEHELVFQTARSSSSGVDIESMPTMSVSSSAADYTFRTQEDPNLTAASDDEFGTRSMNGGSSVQQVAPEQDNVPVTPAPAAFESQSAPASEPAVAETASPPAASQQSISDEVWQVPSQAPSAPLEVDSGVTFSRLTSLPQPSLPDVAPLTAALAALDGQVASLQQQLHETQEAIRNHEADIQQTSNQLRAGVRSVSDRMDKTIADVARTREQLAWSDLLQLMEDVMNNPRDIEYVIKLARKARELNKVFQIHQNVLSTLAECTSLLRGLVEEDR